MRQTFVVEMDDGSTYEIASDARDIRAWESQYEQSWFTDSLSFTRIAQVAYLAGQRTGVLNGQWPDYQTFDAHCVDAKGKRETPLIGNPTQPAVMAGSSAISQSNSDHSPRSSSKRARRS